MTFDEELNALIKEVGGTPASAKGNKKKMSKSEFMSKYINDMYKKRYKERHNEATEFLIESAVSKRTNSDKKKRRGVLKYEY
jgi:hypothetical protein